MLILFLIGLVLLLYFSYIDIKHHQVSNYSLLMMFLIGILCDSALNITIRPILLASLIMFILGYLFWYFNTLGGADAKLLAALAPYLGILNYSQAVLLSIGFILLLGVIGCIFGGIAMVLLKVRGKGYIVEYIPFIPVITLSYICYWIYYYILYLA